MHQGGVCWVCGMQPTTVESVTNVDNLKQNTCTLISCEVNTGCTIIMKLHKVKWSDVLNWIHSEKRWASTSDALYTFKTAFSSVTAVPGQLATGARCWQNAIERFDRIVTLVATKHVLSCLVPLSKLLQKDECYLCVALEAANVVRDVMHSERDCPEVWNARNEDAVHIVDAIYDKPAMSRNRNAQCNNKQRECHYIWNIWSLSVTPWEMGDFHSEVKRWQAKCAVHVDDLPTHGLYSGCYCRICFRTVRT